MFREWANGGINLGYSCNANIARALAANLINSANVYPSRFCSAPPPTLTTPATPGGACIAACNINVNGTPPSTSSSAGTSFSLAVSTSTPACGWTVASPSNWIGVLPTTSAAGSGSFTVNVAPNLGAARSGSLVVGGTKFTITEAAASCAPNCSVAADTSIRLGRGFLSAGPANNFLAWPLTVELFNGSGAPLGGVPVTFTSTNATTTPTTVTTDERGRAPVTVKLGATNGGARVTASVSGLAPLNVNLAAVPASSYISSVTTAWGGYTIAQNTFIEIKGTSLVPADTPASGVIWSSAPEFAQGRMPTTLGGISVTVNGKPAFIYFYCSRNTTTACATDQINVLTPLDTATGPVDVVVTNKGVSTPAFSVEMKAVAPTFLLYSPQGYVIATHANYSYLGPTTLFPGASTPAKVGETVVTYAVGFGLPTATLVNGSSTQSGLLPEAPVCTVNRINAPTSAALIAPGLYQLNITVPSGVRNGDNALDCSYRGASTFAGGLLAVAVP